MLELGKRNEGKWFEIPGEFFAADKVRLQLKLATEDQFMLLSKTSDMKANNRTGIPFEQRNKDRERKAVRKILWDSTLNWENIKEEFNEENFNIFMNSYGSVKVGRTTMEVKISKDSEETVEKEVDLVMSGWIMETIRDAEKMLPNDTKNLQPTSEV